MGVGVGAHHDPAAAREEGRVGDDARGVADLDQPVGPVGPQPQRSGVHRAGEDALGDDEQLAGHRMADERLGVAGAVGIDQLVGLGSDRAVPATDGDAQDLDGVADVLVVAGVAHPDVTGPGGGQGLHVDGVRGPRGDAERRPAVRVDAEDPPGVARVVGRDHQAVDDRETAGLDDVGVGEPEGRVVRDAGRPGRRAQQEGHRHGCTQQHRDPLHAATVAAHRSSSRARPLVVPPPQR